MSKTELLIFRTKPALPLVFIYLNKQRLHSSNAQDKGSEVIFDSSLSHKFQIKSSHLYLKLYPESNPFVPFSQLSYLADLPSSLT